MAKCLINIRISGHQFSRPGRAGGRRPVIQFLPWIMTDMFGSHSILSIGESASMRQDSFPMRCSDARLRSMNSFRTAADINNRIPMPRLHASIKRQYDQRFRTATGQKNHRVLFDGTQDIHTNPNSSGWRRKTAEARHGLFVTGFSQETRLILHKQWRLGQDHLRRYETFEEPWLRDQEDAVPVNAVLIPPDGKIPPDLLAEDDLGEFCHGQCLIGATGTADSFHVHGLKVRKTRQEL